MNYLLSIDPGVVSMGAALFREGKLTKCRVFGLSKPRSPFAAVAYLAGQIDQWVGLSFLRRVGIEQMTIFSDGGRGTAAARDVVDVSMAVGALAMYFMRERDAVVDLVPVLEWKGNMPKSVTHDRIDKVMQETDLDGRRLMPDRRSHDWDAVGIGLHILGRL